jgi:Na+-translocating ferredoxin:NAD+ oxidoreductase subunit C
MSKAKRAFRGGYRFTHFKGKPLEKIVPLETPDIVTVPIQPGSDTEEKPTVKAGDEVRAGQVIGPGPAHSPVDGTVSGISKMPAVTIEKKPEFVYNAESVLKLEGADTDWRKLNADKLEELIFKAGAASLDISGIPTGYGSSAISPEEAEHLIVRIIADELLPASDAVLLSEAGIDSLLEGLRMLKVVLSRARITIAVSVNQKELLGKIESALRPDDGFAVLAVSDKYPQSSEEVLVPTVTGSEFPYGFNAVNIGVILLSVQTVLAVYDAVTAGTPVLSRVIALGGTGFTENLHVQVPVGTAWEFLISKYGVTDGEYRYVKNSLISGETVEDPSSPVTTADSALYAIPEIRTTELMPFASPGFSKDSYSNTFPTSLLPLKKTIDTNIHGEERACLSCSFCADVCPVSILPALLHRYVLRDIIDESMKQFGIFKCIDCNLCTYVCPSKIPVAGLLKKGKQLLIMEGLGNKEEIKNQFSLKGI